MKKRAAARIEGTKRPAPVADPQPLLEPASGAVPAPGGRLRFAVLPEDAPLPPGGVELAPQLGGQSTFGLFGPGLEPLRVAENFERLFGRLERSYYGTPSSFFEAIHPDDRPAVRALLGGRLEAPAEIEVRVQHATSGLRWVWLHASAATSESGAPTVAWWAYDITAQKRAELALERSERAYRELTEEASDGIAIGDAQGYMLYANQAACEILGRSREQLIGVHFTTWFAPGELEKNPVDWDRANRGEVVRNERHITRGDGGLIVVESVTKRLPDGHFESIIRDVTERRRAQDALRLSEERYRLISELTSDFASSVLVGPDGTLRREWITDAFERITGFSPDEVDARGRILCLSEDELRARGTPYLLHPEDGPELERRRRALLAGPWTASQDEFRIVTRSGEVRWIRQTSRRLPSAIGPGVRIYCAAQDITAHKAVEDQRRRYSEHLEAEVRRRTAELEKLNEELRELQQELLAAQRLGVAEDLAGKVAHSINNPLAALIGTAEIALANRRRRDPHIEQILKLGRRIRTVVARTLQLYREGGLVLRGEDPGEILRDVAEELEVRAKPFDVKVSVSVAADLPVLHADRRLLASALASIGENAIEAMPLGGELSLDVRKLDELEVVEFRIADRGPGIPEALREKIFEPFFTTKGSGAGLGLAIARGIIAGHEGHVRVEAREEGGTRVVVALPRYPASDSLASS